MTDQTEPEELLTWAAVAAQLGLSVRSVERLKHDGHIGFVQVRNRVFFRHSDVDECLETAHVPARNHP